MPPPTEDFSDASIAALVRAALWACEKKGYKACLCEDMLTMRGKYGYTSFGCGVSTSGEAAQFIKLNDCLLGWVEAFEAGGAIIPGRLVYILIERTLLHLKCPGGVLLYMWSV